MVYTLKHFLKIQVPILIISENYATNIFGVGWQSAYKSNKIYFKSSGEANLAFKARNVNCLHFKFIAQKLLSCDTCNRNNKKRTEINFETNHLQKNSDAHISKKEDALSFFIKPEVGVGRREGFANHYSGQILTFSQNNLISNIN